MRSRVILLVALILGPASRCAAEPRPNIVLLVTDDQGYGDLGVTGNPVVETPHIDAMARRSAAMAAFYVCPVCTPTRASLLTGRYHLRTRAIDTYIGRAMMDPGELTIAEILRDAGYATGIFGKWHLGDCYPLRASDQGFEESLVLRGGGLAQPSEPPENERRYSDPVLLRDGVPQPTRGYCTDVYFRAAGDWIERSHRGKRPFFAYIATNAPHGPYHDVPADLYEKYRKKDLSAVVAGDAALLDTTARVFAMVENIDRNIGELFARLTALGAVDDTIVILLFDNGPAPRRYAGPFRGTKTMVHEGGIRTPFFVHWPRRLKAGTSSDRPAAHIDVLPTLLDAAGVPLPSGRKLDGRSLLPLLEGRDSAWPERTIVIQSHRGDRPHRYHHFAARRGRWKLVRASGFDLEEPPAGEPVFELYDVVADPGERQDLAAVRTEIVSAIRSDYDAWFDDVARGPWDEAHAPRIVAGGAVERETTLTRQDWRRTQGSGWGTNGRWLLRIERAGVFDVRALLEEPARGEARLSVGGAQAGKALAEPVRRVEFLGIALEAGDAALELVAGEPGRERGAYQVVIARRD